MGGLVSSFIEVHRARVLLNRVEIPFIRHPGAGKTRDAGTEMFVSRALGKDPVLEWASERVCLIIWTSHTLWMTNRGFLPADVSNLVGKVYPSVEVLNYSNSRVLGHGQLASCTWLLSRLITTYGELGEWLDLNFEGDQHLKFLFRFNLEN
jgi:hypothetical protein